MRATLSNAHDWLRQEAHLTTAGQHFHFHDCSCLPVAPEDGAWPGPTSRPAGFLVTHGEDVAFVHADSPDGEAMVTEWERFKIFAFSQELLPSECWFG